MARTQYVLIMAPESETRGRIVHYKEPRPTHDRTLKPLCNPVHWAEQRWIKDPVQGLGADVCGRCIRKAAAIVKEYKARRAAQVRKRYWANRDALMEKNRQYRAQMNGSIARQKRLRYARDREYREKILERNRASRRRKRLTSQNET